MTVKRKNVLSKYLDTGNIDNNNVTTTDSVKWILG